MSELLRRVDHLVYATPDLSRGVEEIEALTGVRATPGGRHPDFGTQNALLALGPAAYLEIIAPDPELPDPAMPRPFGIDTLRASRLVTWAANCRDIHQIGQAAAACGVALGEVLDGRRQRPDGVTLSWRFTNPYAMIAGGVVPFFIDWGQSPHPAGAAKPGLALLDLHAEHPDPVPVRAFLQHLHLDLAVHEGPQPALVARIAGPAGVVELR